jgi:plastocyanin
VEDFAFEPQILTIAPGDTVIWTATAQEHTVTADQTYIPNPAVPTDVRPIFDSSNAEGTSTMPLDSTFTVTFNEIGNFPYYCRIHGSPGTFTTTVTNSASAPAMGNMPMSAGDNMVGMIRVQVPTENHAPNTPENNTPLPNATGVSSSPILKSSAFIDPDEGDHHVSSQWLIKLASTGEVLLDSGTDKDNLVSLPIENLPLETQIKWQVRYRDDRGLWSEYSAETTFTTLSPDDPDRLKGLNGTYSAYNLKKDAISKSVQRVDPEINFDWGMGRPHPSISPNNFHISWKGKVVPQFTERYLFRVKADSGVRLKINNQPIIDDWIVSKFPLYRSGSVDLEAGIAVPIELEFFDTSKEAEIMLRWSSPSTPLSVIPAERLIPTN